jgi:hypothetical protein
MPVRGLSKWIRSLKIGKSPDYTGFEVDGTMVAYGKATTFRDELNDLSRTGLNNPANAIEVDTTENTLNFKTNAVITDYATMNIQLNHDRKLGSNVHAHFHWFQSSATMPNMMVQYRWQKECSPKTTAWTSIKWVGNACEYVSGTINQITGFSEIVPPTGDSLSDILQVRFIRDTANASGLFAGADTLAAPVVCTSFDAHIECDMLGSREEYLK